MMWPEEDHVKTRSVLDVVVVEKQMTLKVSSVKAFVTRHKSRGKWGFKGRAQ